MENIKQNRVMIGKYLVAAYLDFCYIFNQADELIKICKRNELREILATI